MIKYVICYTNELNRQFALLMTNELMTNERHKQFAILMTNEQMNY